MVRHKYIRPRISVEDGGLWEVGLVEDVRLDMATEQNLEDLFLYKTQISILQTQGNISGNTEFSSSKVRFSNSVNSHKKILVWVRRKDWMSMRCWSNISMDRIKPIKPFQLIVANCWLLLIVAKSKRHEADRPKLFWQSSKLEVMQSSCDHTWNTRTRYD